MSHTFRWMREHGTLHIPDVRAQNRFSNIRFLGDSRTFLPFPCVSKGNLLEG